MEVEWGSHVKYWIQFIHLIIGSWKQKIMLQTKYAIGEGKKNILFNFNIICSRKSITQIT